MIAMDGRELPRAGGDVDDRADGWREVASWVYLLIALIIFGFGVATCSIALSEAMSRLDDAPFVGVPDNPSKEEHEVAAAWAVLTRIEQQAVCDVFSGARGRIGSPVHIDPWEQEARFVLEDLTQVRLDHDATHRFLSEQCPP